MKIYVDADACPKPVKEILCKAANRTNIALIFVANKPLTIPKLPMISAVQVGRGFDVADDYIAASVVAGDLVITADIPLADKVVSKQATALNPRGGVYTQDNIKRLLSVRNFMDELRSTGVPTGGPEPFTNKNKQQFANSLDKYLAKAAKECR